MVAIHNLAITAHRGASVHHGAKGSFMSFDETNLIISKGTWIEVYKIEINMLVWVTEINLHARIESLNLQSDTGHSTCNLLVLTDRRQLLMLRYNADTRFIETVSMVSLAEVHARPQDERILATLDPDNRIVAFSLYTAALHVFFTDDLQKNSNEWKSNGVSSTYSVVEKASVLSIPDNTHSIVALYSSQNPYFAILYSDKDDERHLKMCNTKMDNGQLNFSRCFDIKGDIKDHTLIAVPPPSNGVLVVGDALIAYHSLNGIRRTISVQSLHFTAYSFVDNTRCILGDTNGSLYILRLLFTNNTTVSGLSLDPIGQVPGVPSTLLHLKDDLIYVGSNQSDSCLISLSSSPPGNIEIIKEYPNLGPILDFCLYDVDRQGQTKMVCCSGTENNGSLRIVQSGVGFRPSLYIPSACLKRVWPLGSQSSVPNRHDILIISTTLQETKVLHQVAESQQLVEMIKFSAIRLDESTLAVGVLKGGLLVQVTTSSVRWMDSEQGGNLIGEWQSPQPIQLAKLKQNQCVVTYGRGNLVYLEAIDGTITQKSAIQCDNEISCIDIGTLGEPFAHQTQVVAVGFWTGGYVQLLRLPELTLLASDALPNHVPHNIILTKLEEVEYVITALENGDIAIYNINPSEPSLRDPRLKTISTYPVTLSLYDHHGTPALFLTSLGTPTIMYSQKKSMVYVVVDTEESVIAFTEFKNDSLNSSVLLANHSTLYLGQIDTQQKLCTSKVKFDNQAPQKIIYHRPTGTLAVGMLQTDRRADNTCKTTKGLLCFVDARSFRMLKGDELLPGEAVESMAKSKIEGQTGTFIFVGTSCTSFDESTDVHGRILIYKLTAKRNFTLVEAVHLTGAVYNIKSFQGTIVASVYHSIYKFTAFNSEAPLGSRASLTKIFESNDLITAMDTRKKLLVAGDLKQSTSLLTLSESSTELTQLGLNTNVKWATAVQFIADSLFISANQHTHLSTLKYSPSDGTNNHHLIELAGEVYLGDQVNCFRPGSLADDDCGIGGLGINTPITYGTVDGSIGVVMRVTKDTYTLLHNVQSNMVRVLQSLGQTFGFKLGSPAYIDGDFLCQYLKLSPQDQKKVVQGYGRGIRLNYSEDILQKVIQKLCSIR